MKKLFIAAPLVLLSIFNVQANNTEPVSQAVQRAFQKEFRSITNVNWSRVDGADLYRATFQINNTPLNAYFSPSGEFVGTSRYINQQHLPATALRKVQRHFSKYVIRTVIERSTGDATTYHITGESDRNVIYLIASPNGELSIDKKVKKA